MTLSDLGKLIAHFWKWVVVIPILCALIVGGVAYMQPAEYEATTTITASGEIGALGGIASTAAAERSGNGVKITAKADTTSKLVKVTASGKDGKACMLASISAARRAVDRAESMFPAQNYSLSNASTFKDASTNPIKVALLAFCVGVFTVLCILVGWSSIKRPVISPSDLARSTKLPILGAVPFDDEGERLFANLMFACDGDRVNKTISVCVIPTSARTGIDAIVVSLEEAAKRNAYAFESKIVAASQHEVEVLSPTEGERRLRVLQCAPLAEGMGAAFAGRSCNLVVIAVSGWVDSLKQVEMSLDELVLVGVVPLGFIWTKRAKRSREHPE